MKDKDKTKEQLITELARLRQENNELKLAQNDKDYSSTVSELSSPSRRFFANGFDSFVSLSNGGQQRNSNKYHISDLIDIPLLKKLLNSYYASTGISHSLIDTDNKILIQEGWQDICTKFHRGCPQTKCRCQQSDSYIASHLHDGPYIGYKCLNGLVDYAVPIVIAGEHLATIYKGQFLYEQPDEDYFRRQAEEFGFDKEAYIEALRHVPIIPKDQVGSIMEFFSQLGQFLTTIGLERKRQLDSMDQALKEREELLRLILEASTDGFWDLNIETGEIYRSSRWIDILGYAHEEIESNLQSWEKHIHPDDNNIAMKALNEYLDGKIPKYEIEYRLVTESGELKWIFERGTVILSNEKGEPLRMAGTCADITDRKRMEEALRLSEECFSKAFNASPVLMTITTVAEGKYIKANHAFCSTMGYSNEEIIGKSSFELGFWSDPIDRYLVEQRLMANQSVQDMEIRFSKNTGEQRWGLFSAERLEVHGESCLLCIVTDITELRQMEVEMTRLDRLNVVGEMAASIGHEIRNPMTTVRGYLQLLQGNKNYNQEIEYFNLMIEELDRANSIITEFLSLAKNKMLDMTLQNLNSIINKSLPLIQVKAMSRDQIIKLELQDLPDLLLDEKEIRQLILNLVNNGIESMSSPGNITIGTFIEKEDVVLAVKDEGHGIDHKLLDKLGTPFFTTKEQGTGLGLAVCYRIASRHNAPIDIDTNSNGTTFFVRFPIPASVN